MQEQRFLKTELGIVDLKKGTKDNPYYEKGDLFIMLPEYDGRELSFEEKLELTNKGVLGKVIKWTDPYYTSEDGFTKLRFKQMLIEVEGEKSFVHPVYYRLGWKLKKY